MNNEQEKNLELKLKKMNEVNLGLNENKMNELLTEISEFIQTSNIGDIYELNTASTHLPDFIVHKELREKFDSIWTFQEGDKIYVEICTNEKRRLLDNMDLNEIRKTLDTYLGFTKIFRLLVDFQKPLIVHNGFMDMLYLYEKFYEPLPDTIDEFKTNLNRLTPVIFDTKHISVECKKIHKEIKELYDSTALEKLFSWEFI